MSKNRRFDGHKNNYSEPTTKYPPGGSTGCRVELSLRSVCRASAGNLLMIKKTKTNSKSDEQSEKGRKKTQSQDE